MIIVGSGGAAVKGTVNFGGAKFVGVTRNGDMIAAANVEDEILRAIVRKNQDLFPNGAGNRTGAELKKYVDDILNGAARNAPTFTARQIDDYVVMATKNPKAEKVMLGKFDNK